jgi:Ca2+-binding RTX toxin-like protein
LQFVDETLTRAIDANKAAGFGQTDTGTMGDPFEFDVPEGEGTFTVDVTYNAFAHLTSSIGLQLASDYSYVVLGGSIHGSITGFSAGADFAVTNETVPLAGTVTPIYSNTDTYDLGTRQESVVVAFEKFRTVDQSGDNFHFTAHQITGTGNDRPNVLIGNAFDNVIDGLDGDDHLVGGAGDDTLNGGDGSDWLEGGDGNNFLYGGAGNDVISAGAGQNPFIDGGDDDDIVIGGTVGGSVMLAGGNGADRIVSGSANEELHGGAIDSIEVSNGNQSDTFVFAPGCGHDHIWDINSLQRTSQAQNDPYLIDTIDLTAFTQYHSFDDLVAAGCFRTDPIGRVEIVLDIENWPYGYNDSISFDGVFNGPDFKDIVKQAHWLFAGMDSSAMNGTYIYEVLMGGPTP